jgi:hypothetical protein
METKQSSIDFLIDWMSKNEYFIGNDLLKEIEKAKEMHKQEIMDAYRFGLSDDYVIGSQRYYNETFVAQK